MTVIEIENLRKTYKSRTALDGISLTVNRDEILGIAGTNGAGKTTLVECASGLRRRDSGVLRVLGLDPQTDRRALQQRIGVQLQESALPDALRVGEAFRLYAALYDDPVDWRALMDEWGLTDRRKSRFGSLSGGWKQRVFIALALIGNPEVVFLDELTTGLDPMARRTTWGLIERLRATGLTVVLVTHSMDEAQAVCDRVAIVDAGRVIASGSPRELITWTQTDSLDSAYLALTGRDLS
ncbi:ABC transporter ATP-binding protein [Kribbella sp. NPDC004875]|uniref:ABC transporter ATP-binding protein n=1 Tax=Kribbella sp. NPDC004875 TaxID=3364107 RepID=UPI00369F3207